MRCLCAASLVHLASHARKTWSSPSSRSSLTHHLSVWNHCSVFLPDLPQQSLMTPLGWLENSQAQPQQCFDFWGRLYPVRLFSRPGDPIKQQCELPCSASLRQGSSRQSTVVMTTQDAVHAHPRGFNSNVEYFSRNYLWTRDGWLYDADHPILAHWRSQHEILKKPENHNDGSCCHQLSTFKFHLKTLLPAITCCGSHLNWQNDGGNWDFKRCQGSTVSLQQHDTPFKNIHTWNLVCPLFMTCTTHLFIPAIKDPLIM